MTNQQIDLVNEMTRLELENKELKKIIIRIGKDKAILETNKVIINCVNGDCKFHEWRKGCQHKEGACNEYI